MDLGRTGLRTSSDAPEGHSFGQPSHVRVLVTGGTAGIGRAFAIDRALRGDHVQVVGRDPAKLDGLRRELHPARVDLYRCDLSSVTATREFAESYRSHGEPLDLLFLNAGIWQGRSQVSDEGIDSGFAVNYLHRFLLTVLLSESVRRAPRSRILVNGDPRYVPALQLEDGLFGRTYDGFPSSGLRSATQALAANTYLVYWLNRTFDTGVPISLIDPGFVKTGLVKRRGGLLAVLAKLDFVSIKPEESARGISEFIAQIDPLEADGRAFRKTKPLQVTPKVTNGFETFRVLWQQSCALGEVGAAVLGE